MLIALLKQKLMNLQESLVIQISQENNQKNLLLAIADPSSLVEKAVVAALDPATAGTTIAAGTGQVKFNRP